MTTCKLLLIIFLALSLATSASTPTESSSALTARLVPAKHTPVYSSAIDDEHRGFKRFFVALAYFPFHRGAQIDCLPSGAMQRKLSRPYSSSAKLTTVLLI